MEGPQDLDGLRMSPHCCHMQGRGAYMVDAMRVRTTLQQPLDGLVPTNKRKQVQKSARGHMLVLENKQQ